MSILDRYRLMTSPGSSRRVKLPVGAVRTSPANRHYRDEALKSQFTAEQFVGRVPERRKPTRAERVLDEEAS